MRCTWEVQLLDLPAVGAIDLHASVRCLHVAPAFTPTASRPIAILLVSWFMKHSPGTDKNNLDSESETSVLDSGFFMTLSVALLLRSNSLAFVSLRTVRIASARMAVPKLISDVMRDLEARYECDPALTKVLVDSKGVNVCLRVRREKDPSINTIVQATGFVDLSAVGQIIKLLHAVIALKEAEAEAELLQRKGVGEMHLDQPLDSVVLSKLGDSELRALQDSPPSGS